MKLLTNRADIWLFVYERFGVRLGHTAFSEGHSTPLDFVVDALANSGDDIAAWACRSGGKTLGASLIAAIEYLRHDNLEGRVLSGSEDQARYLYEYWCRWCCAVLSGRIDGPQSRQRTAVAGGSFEILAASQKRVRGGKVQRLFEDEVDEISPEIDAAAVGMVASRGDLRGRTVYTSTWHRTGGPMGQLIENAETSGIRIHKWNIWEAIARCPADRHARGRGCDECPLEGPCRDKARVYHCDVNWPVGIAAEAGGLYCVDDVIKAYRKLSERAWDCEYLCRRPSAEGLVWPEFNPLEHSCATPPANLKIYRSIDWGCGVFVCLWIGVGADSRAYVLDTYRAEHGTLRQHADYINSHRLQDVRKTFCDPAGRNRSDQTGRSSIDVFAQYGIRCNYSLSSQCRSVAIGIRQVRSMLSPASGLPRLCYVPNDANRVFVKAMQNYHNRKTNGIYVDEPQDPQEYEHIPDALRYFCVNISAPSDVKIVGYGTA